MVGGSEHKVVLDESGFRAYCVGVDWGLNSYPSFFLGGYEDGF